MIRPDTIPAGTTRSLLVRAPSTRLAEGLLTHVERQPVDVDLAVRQWRTYVDTLAELGWSLIEVPTAEQCPDSVFIEDTVVMFRGTAIITRPGADQRRPEIDDVEKTVRALGIPTRRVEAPGHLDGGDVLKIGDTVYVGRSGRTDEAGIESFSRVVSELGGRVVTVPLSKVLHLKSAVTALPDGTVIGWDPVVDDPSVFPNYRSVPEESGAHVVVLDDHTILMAASAPLTVDEFRREGWRVVTVDISEFEKLEGCVTCLSVRVRPDAG